VPEPDAIVLVVDDEALVLANMYSTSSPNSLSSGTGLACSTSRSFQPEFSNIRTHFSRNSSGLVAQVETAVKAGWNTAGVFSSDQPISMVPIQNVRLITLGLFDRD
jgi:hypothetical protein